ncbi:MAG: hypothetical protein L0211_23450 [Planctomycetaceae bacterium]|nr:hypothetical protein [Planctomycetaceae bacterium]
MIYHVTLELKLESENEPDRIERQARSLFHFGTMAESLADGLKLMEDPMLLSVEVEQIDQFAERKTRKH